MKKLILELQIIGISTTIAAKIDGRDQVVVVDLLGFLVVVVAVSPVFNVFPVTERFLSSPAVQFGLEIGVLLTLCIL